MSTCAQKMTPIFFHHTEFFNRKFLYILFLDSCHSAVWLAWAKTAGRFLPQRGEKGKWLIRIQSLFQIQIGPFRLHHKGQTHKTTGKRDETQSHTNTLSSAFKKKGEQIAVLCHGESHNNFIFRVIQPSSARKSCIRLKQNNLSFLQLVSLSPLCSLTLLQVEFVISYNGRGELVAATVDVALASVDLGDLLLQTHSVHFKVTSRARSLSPNELQIHEIPPPLFLPSSWLQPDKLQRCCHQQPDLAWGLHLWDASMERWSLYPQ